jgi:RNA polymerase primary sigma factor
MPRTARFRVAAIDELFRQLRYTPPETLHRLMDNAERLVAEIDPARNYPEDFVVFRITGYRPEGAGERVLVGGALLPDVVNFVQRISRRLHLPPDHAGRRALALEDVAARLRVAMKTLQRYRRQGLICHYVAFSDGRGAGVRLACFENALERFVRAHRERIERAADFTRIEPEEASRTIAEASKLRRLRGLSLNEAARLLAERHGRAHETLRMLLRRHDHRAADPIFAEPGPISERQAIVMHRAWQRGIETAAMARRFGRSGTTIQRIINRRRAMLLRSLDLHHTPLPTFERDDAAEVILSHPAVTSALDELLPAEDALALLAAARCTPPASPDAVDALIAGYNFLKRRASETIAQLESWPRARPLDAAETDLRWAAKLKRRLMSLGLPTAVKAIDQHMRRPLETQPAEAMVARVWLAFEVIGDVVERVNPSRGQQFGRLCAMAMDRAQARIVPRDGSRAGARHAPGSVPLGDPFFELTAWAGGLEPRTELRRHLHRLADQPRRLIAARHGWEGGPPLTLAAVATRFQLPESRAARTLRNAVRELRKLARGG